MKLLENVRGKASSPETLAAVMAMGKIIKKIPVLVGNCFGFVGNRMLEPYGRESAYLVEEGASPALVDKVIFGFGMAMGPFSMSDLAGNDIGYKIRKSLGLLDVATRPKGERYHGGLGDKLVKMERLGMKTNAGWYKYSGRDRKEDPIVEKMIEEHRKEIGRKPRKISNEEIIERCLYPLVNVGFQCLEEGIALRPGDIDIIWLYGYGFPAYRGGPMYWADTIGLPKVLEAMTKYQKQNPDVAHWKPSKLLVKLANEGVSLQKYWQKEVMSKGKAARSRM
jgi:3-hydroxyacyl-CoA dehydrogenase